MRTTNSHLPKGMPHVLIFTGGGGQGHRSPASAIEEQLKEQKLSYHREEIPKDSPGSRNRWDHFLYTLNNNKFIYRLVDLYRVKSSQKDMLDRICTAINSEKPDVIVTNHRYFTRFAARARQELDLHMPIVVLHPDHGSPHASWFPPQMLKSDSKDVFIAPTDKSHKHTLKKVPSSVSVLKAGYPVRQAFEEIAEKPMEIARREAKLSPESHDKPLILITGGSGEWGDYTAKITKRVASKGLNVHIVAVAGKSEALSQQLHAIQPSGNTSLEIREKCEAPEMAALTRACKCILTKAGGATLGEIQRVGAIPIIYQCLSGPERGNAAYIRENGIGIIALNEKRVLRAISDVLDGKVNVEEIRNRQASGLQPTPAKKIAEHICSLAQSQFKERKGIITR